jgi:hypothetical protein
MSLLPAIVILITLCSGAAEVRPVLPLAFARHDETHFARGTGYAIALHHAEARLRTGAALHTLRFIGAVPATAGPEQPLPGKVNLVQGSDRRQWKPGLPTWSRVHYRNIYPGIDLIYYGSGQQLEFDLVLAPGADARRILFEVSGGTPRLDPAGELHVGELALHRPRLYQQRDGRRTPLS